MAARKQQTTVAEPVTSVADPNGNATAVAWNWETAEHKNLYLRMERGLARRLYEVWRTVGGLDGERWEWTNQSTRAQQAWLVVARASLGPALQERFGQAEMAALMHA